MSENQIFLTITIPVFWGIFGALLSWHLNAHSSCEKNRRKTAVIIFLCGPLFWPVAILSSLFFSAAPFLVKLNRTLLKYWEKL